MKSTYILLLGFFLGRLRKMPIGTKSILFGCHCFFIHPIFVALAWIRLYGFPLDPRIWIAFLVHDLGYVGRRDIGGSEGKEHPYFGAKLMGYIFDRNGSSTWYEFTLSHSRYTASKEKIPPSKLCYADKLAFCLTPNWIYIPMGKATKEVYEFMNEDYMQDELEYSNTEIRIWLSGAKSKSRKWISEEARLGNIV